MHASKEMDTFSFLSSVISNEIHNSRNQEPAETAVDFHIETTRVMDSASDGHSFAWHFSLSVGFVRPVTPR